RRRRPLPGHRTRRTGPTKRTLRGDQMTWGMRWPGPDVGRRAEAAGCAAFCTGEFADGNAYMALAEMAANTTTAKVGTGVAYAFARSPFVHASGLRHADKLAPGRVFCGLGSGTRRMNEDWFSVPADRPLGRMADLVGAIRAFTTAPNGKAILH